MIKRTHEKFAEYSIEQTDDGQWRVLSPAGKPWSKTYKTEQAARGAIMATLNSFKFNASMHEKHGKWLTRLCEAKRIAGYEEFPDEETSYRD